MKKVTNKKTRRIATALASLSMLSALAMPASALSASAAETAPIELPEISTETTVIANTDEDIALIETVEEAEAEEEEAVTTALAIEETAPETTTEAVKERSEKDKIKDYFDEEFADFDSDACAAELDYADESQYGVKRSGNNLLVTKSEHVENSKEKDILNLTNTNSTVYPGALVYADKRLAEGRPGIIRIDRGDVNVRVENGPIAKGIKRSRTLTPSMTSVKDMMGEIEDNCLDEASATPARFTLNYEEVKSDEDLKAKAHLEQSLYGKLKLDSEMGIGEKKQMVLVDFTQIYYTVSADLQMGEELFGDNVTLADVQKVISADSPAAMVTSVDYGRRVVACIETTDKSFNLKTELEGAGMGEKIKANASLKLNNKLENCSVTFFVYGGSANNSGNVVKCTGTDQLVQLFETLASDMKYQRNIALPVAYTTSFAHNGDVAKVNFKSNYFINKTETITPTPINIESGHMFHGFFGHGDVESHTVKITGQRITGLDEYGNFTHGEEEVIYDKTFYNEGMKENDFKAIPADFDLSTVKIRFDYKGYKGTGFREDENNIKPTYIVSNPRDIKSIDVFIESRDSNIPLVPWASYDVSGKVKVTDNSDKTGEKKIWDK